MIEGEAHMFTGDEHFTAHSGDIFLLPSDEEHGGTADSEARVSFIWMHFSAVDSTASAYLSSLPRIIPSVKETPIPSLSRSLLHKSRFLLYKHDVLDATAALFAMEYETWGAAVSKEEGRELIHRAREWVRINADKQLTVTDVAAEFGYNADYLSSLFKRKNGESLKSYIDAMRMNALRTQLLTTDKPLKNIAIDFGFQDYKAFLKFFTYHEGMTPTEYREACYMTHKNNK
jgi:AraC-like DNA-binding protein